MKKRILFAAAMVASFGWAQDKAPDMKVVSTDVAPVTSSEVEDESGLKIDFGGEVRVRYETYNYIPSTNHGQSDHMDYLRVRTRLWGKATLGRLEGFLRLGNEFRHYRAQSSEKGNRRFPDVLFIDQLYLKAADVGDFVDIKIGRQEFLFGSKRIFMDLTDGDGSRSNFADGLRLTFKFDHERTLDAFAFYVNRDDWLPTAGHRHDARRKNTKSYDYDLTGYNHDECAAGFHYTDASRKELPWEAYYVVKAELDGDSVANTSKVIPADENSFTTHTVGFRILPKLTETLSGEIEVAGQVGDDSLFAMMAYGGLTYAPKWTFKPKFTAAVQYLSGDKEGGRGDRAWHAVYDRDTFIGEAFGSTFSSYAHHNILYPHLKVILTPAEHHTFSAHTGPLFAPVAELDGNGGEYGHFYGYHLQAKYTLAIGKRFDLDYARGLNAAILGEYLSKGDYYRSDARNDAYFLRLELTYSF